MGIDREQLLIPGTRVRDKDTGATGEAVFVRYHINGSAKVQIKSLDTVLRMADLERVEIVK